MGAVWISYVGKIMLSISLEYYRYCDSEASKLATAISNSLNYPILIYYSLCRCRQIQFPEIENNQGLLPISKTVVLGKGCLLKTSNKAQSSYGFSKSWSTFMSDSTEMSWTEYIWRKKLMCLCIVYGSSAVVLFIYIAGICGVRFIKYYDEVGCICSLSSVKMSARAIAIAKLILEPLVHIVYSPEASTKSKVVYRIQYALLALTAGLCFILLLLMGSKSMYRPNSLSYLFWRVPPQEAVTEITKVRHVLAVSVFGLLEPLRSGSTYPEQ